jgi:hypothetical protein
MAQHRLGRRSPLTTEAKPDTKILDELLPPGLSAYMGRAIWFTRQPFRDKPLRANLGNYS